MEAGKRINAHAWQRQYENALVIMNLPGAKESYTIKFQEAAKDSLTGNIGDGLAIEMS